MQFKYQNKKVNRILKAHCKQIQPYQDKPQRTFSIHYYIYTYYYIYGAHTWP